jgi:hypothetical protein
METPNLLTLVNRLRQTEHVAQVRYHQVLKQRFRDLVGVDGISVVCLLTNKANPEKFVKIVTILEASVIENLDRHDAIIEDIKTRIDDYIIRDIRPPKF